MYLRRLLSLFLSICIILPLKAGAVGYSGYDFDLESFKEYKNSDYAPARELYQMIAEATPVLDQLNILKSQIVPILQVHYQATHSMYSKKYMELFEKTFERDYGGWKDPAYREIRFEALGLDEDGGRFQVDGVEKDRLAINTGKEIIFNVRGLSEIKPSLVSLFQLWLHELSHVDQATPLSDRDAWASDVATWFESNTKIVELDGVKFISVTLPKSQPQERLPGTPRWGQKMGDLPLEALRGFLLIRETKAKSEIYTPAYSGFKTFGDVIESETAAWPEARPDMIWPSIEVTGIRKSAQGHLIVDYTQRTEKFVRESTYPGYQDYVRDSSPAAPRNRNIKPTYPDTKYSIEVDPQTGQAITQRNYSNPMQIADFEIYRTQDVKDKTYVSLRARVDESTLSLQNLDIHLNAKDLQTKKPLSVKPLSQKRLNKNEVQLHFELPRRNIEFQQLIVPQVITNRNDDTQGFYHEKVILPSRPAVLTRANTVAAEPTMMVAKEFIISPRQVDLEKVRVEMKLFTNKKIVGITLDVDHTLRTQEINTGNGMNAYAENYQFIGAGRKYYFSQKDLDLRQLGDLQDIRFDFPEALMSQIRRGMAVRQRISRFFTQIYEPKYRTIEDLKKRTIKNAVIHFSDGTSSSVPKDLLPPEFTTESVEETSKAYRDAWARAQKLSGAMDDGTPAKKRPPAPRCERVFSMEPEISYADQFG